MIRKLLITNYILIDKVEIDFTEGFNVITGETGAGKSILIGALSLLSGQRADTNTLRDSEKKCVIEADIELFNEALKPLFDSLDLEFDKHSILRREILPSGKSRAFINDTPVNLKVLDLCSKALFDIHSQHQNALIKDEEFRLSVVDLLADNENIRNKYQEYLESYTRLKKQIEKLKSEHQKQQDEQEFLQFHFEQLDKANLKKGELETLESELSELSHAEEIKQALSGGFYLLSESEQSVISQLLSVENELEKIANYFPKAEAFKERIRSNIIDLQDLAPEIESSSEDVEYNPERIDFINERIQTIVDLQRKHQVDSEEELMAIKDKLDQQLQRFSNFDFDLKEQESALNKVYRQLKEITQTLTESRKSVFTQIEKNVSETLKDMGMPKAIFKVKHHFLNDFESTGLDQIIFAFSANKGVDVDDISKIASGGERSRLMLAIKTMLSRNAMVSTLILDEVDTGVSGEVAGKMGELMKQISKDRQLIVITHLPQIAAKANHHFKVKKEDENRDKTQSTVVKLSDNERVDEIASLLSGEHITESAKANAKDLLN